MQLVKGSRKRPLAGVNGEVCIEKIKKLWKERKKDLTRASIVRDGRIFGLPETWVPHTKILGNGADKGLPCKLSLLVDFPLESGESSFVDWHRDGGRYFHDLRVG